MSERPWKLTFTRQAQNTRLNMAAMRSGCLQWNQSFPYRFFTVLTVKNLVVDSKNSVPPFWKREIA